MADVLGVIQDVLNQDKQQKKDHAKMMREVQKKLKEREVSEEDGPGDGDEYQKFVKATLKRFKVKSPSELAPDKKKAFYDALDAGWEGDDEKPEPEDEQADLGDRVTARMKAEEDEDENAPSDDTEEPEEEDEDEAPVGDQDEPEAEADEDEVEGEKLDKLADLVIQKLKDKQSEEEDEEEEPDATEAEGGKTEKIDTQPKVEHLNPHRRSIWEEALKQVNEIRWDLMNKGPEPLPVIIKSVGKQLRDYALKSGGIDKDDFLTTSDVMLKGKLPRAKQIPKDTAPREFVHDLMAKTFGWKFVEQKYGITFNNRRDYVESVEIAEGAQISAKDFDALKKGDTVTIDYGSAMSGGKASFKVTAKNVVGKEKVEKATLQSVSNPKGVKHFLYKRGDKVSMAQGDMAVTVKSFTKESVEVDEAWGGVRIDDLGMEHDDKLDIQQWNNKQIQLYVDKKLKPTGAKRKAVIKAINKIRNDVGMPLYKESVEVDEAKKFKAQCQECGKKFSTANMIPSCPKCHGSDIELAEEIIVEYSDTAWVDKEARKIEHKWKRSSKSQKNKWRKKMADRAEDEELSQAELDDVLDDYGMTSKFDESVSAKAKLEGWGIDIHKEGYMIMPGIDREKYTDIRGMEGPFMTRSGKVLYYDPKAGEYYDRDSDMYLDYSAYLEYDRESVAQKADMAKSVFADPKSREYKSMIKIKKKAEKAAQKAARRLSNESTGMSFVRKHYKKDTESV